MDWPSKKMRDDFGHRAHGDGDCDLTGVRGRTPSGMCTFCKNVMWNPDALRDVSVIQKCDVESQHPPEGARPRAPGVADRDRPSYYARPRAPACCGWNGVGIGNRQRRVNIVVIVRLAMVIAT